MKKGRITATNVLIQLISLFLFRAFHSKASMKRHKNSDVIFGQDPQVGLRSSVLLKNAIFEKATEEELEVYDIGYDNDRDRSNEGFQRQ